MDEVSEAELMECAAQGHFLDGDEGRGRRLVPAGLVRRLCLESSDLVDARGIQLRNAVVSGELDIAGMEIPFPLIFEACEFEEPLKAEGARLDFLVVTGSVLPGLLANVVQVRRDMNLSGSRITGTHRADASVSRRAAVWLCESQIGGRLLCSGAEIRADGERAIQADQLRTGGNVRFLQQFTAYGEIRLIGARLGGSLDIVDAAIVAPDGVALDLTSASVEGSLFLINTVIEGRVDMSSARVSEKFLARSATLSAPVAAPAKSGYNTRLLGGGTAVSAPRLTVGAEVVLETGCTVGGGIDFSMGSMSSLLIETGCSLRAPGSTALDLTNTEILSAAVIGEEVPVEGTVRLTGANLHGDLIMRRARLSAPAGGQLVEAQGARIDGEVRLEELQADGGELSFRAAVIGGAVEAHGARLCNPAGWTLSLVQANVKGSVRLTWDFESTGKVVLNRALVEGRLLCSRGTFSCPGPSDFNQRGRAIEAISATVSGGMDLAWKSASPSADFTNAKTSFLADDPTRWPEHFIVSGFTYDRLEQPQGLPSVRTWDHVARCAWLRRQDTYDAGPYEQAARVYRQHGYTAGAKAILIAQRTHARSAISGRNARLRRALDTGYSLTVGYGYKPARVLWLIATLLILVTATLQIPAARASLRATNSAGAVYTTAGQLDARAPASAPHQDACGDGQVRCFNPVFYAIDTVIPLISLDQRNTWYVDPSTSSGMIMGWWLNIAAILGWLLSSVFVLSLASLARST